MHGTHQRPPNTPPLPPLTDDEVMLVVEEDSRLQHRQLVVVLGGLGAVVGPLAHLDTCLRSLAARLKLKLWRGKRRALNRDASYFLDDFSTKGLCNKGVFQCPQPAASSYRAVLDNKAGED